MKFYMLTNNQRIFQCNVETGLRRWYIEHAGEKLPTNGYRRRIVADENDF
jgi:hypothetical protein